MLRGRCSAPRAGVTESTRPRGWGLYRGGNLWQDLEGGAEGTDYQARGAQRWREGERRCVWGGWMARKPLGSWSCGRPSAFEDGEGVQSRDGGQPGRSHAGHPEGSDMGLIDASVSRLLIILPAAGPRSGIQRGTLWPLLSRSSEFVEMDRRKTRAPHVS